MRYDVYSGVQRYKTKTQKMLLVGVAFASAAAIALANFLPVSAHGQGEPNGPPNHQAWQPVGSLDAGPEINRQGCENLASNPMVVNVTQTVQNDDDSGVAGNAWAHDDYTRTIKVFKTTTEDVYCAVLYYEGVFETYAGPSPQNTGTIPAGIQGTMRGGYRVIVTGNFSPSAATSGSIGNYDYDCDGSFNCPGRVDWTTLYFDPAVSGFDYQWWGWKYVSNVQDHKSRWINACTGPDFDCPGNSGDIL